MTDLLDSVLTNEEGVVAAPKPTTTIDDDLSALLGATGLGEGVGQDFEDVFGGGEQREPAPVATAAAAAAAVASASSAAMGGGGSSGSAAWKDLGERARGTLTE